MEGWDSFLVNCIVFIRRLGQTGHGMGVFQKKDNILWLMVFVVRHFCPNLQFHMIASFFTVHFLLLSLLHCTAPQLNSLYIALTGEHQENQG